MAPSRTTTPAPPTTRVTRSQAQVTQPSGPVLRTSLRASRSSRDLSLNASTTSATGLRSSVIGREPLGIVGRNSVDDGGRGLGLGGRKVIEKEKVEKESFLKRVTSRASTRNLKTSTTTGTSGGVVERKRSVVFRSSSIVNRQSALIKDKEMRMGEGVLTYLRIRPPAAPSSPPPSNSTSFSSLQILNPTTVSLTPPPVTPSPSQPTSIFPPSQANIENYVFTSLLPPSTSQSQTFNTTALPILNSFVEENRDGLLFCYGTTGSGKTWTVMGEPQGSGNSAAHMTRMGGGGTDGEGLLGRSVRYVWEKVGGNVTGNVGIMEGGQVGKKKRGLLQDILFRSFGEAARKERVGAEVYISYFEIYNEKIYDLLATNSNSTSTTKDGTTTLSSWLGVSSPSKGTIKRNALPLKMDKDAGKSVAGLREVSIGSLDQALSLIALGRINRQVYSTLLNSTSSRSHAVFTIRIVRPSSAYGHGHHPNISSKFSIVDLAGSERANNTGTSGERLKEAGSINRSLMVLGQCLETLRENVKREREGKKLVIVPFRHSKLTEIFQGFFNGDGKAAMIVTIDPYTTSYEENTHVLRFSAVAREVVLLPPPQPVTVVTQPRITASEKKKGRKSIKVHVGEREEELEIDVDVEEGEGEGDDMEEDPVWKRCVELWDENRRLKLLLLDERIKWSERELEIKDTMADYYEGKIRELEEQHHNDMADRVLAEEHKSNMKLDLMNRAWQASRTSITESIEEESEPDEDEAACDLSLVDGDVNTPSRVPGPRPGGGRVGDRPYSTNYESEESDVEFGDDGEEDVTMHGTPLLGKGAGGRERRSSLAKSLKSIRSSRSMRMEGRPASRASVRFITPQDEDEENDGELEGSRETIPKTLERMKEGKDQMTSTTTFAGRTPGRVSSLASLRSTRNLRELAANNSETKTTTTVARAHERARSVSRGGGRVILRSVAMKDEHEEEEEGDSEKSLVVDVDEEGGFPSVSRKPSRRLVRSVRQDVVE